MKSLLNKFRKDERGVTAIEYGLIAAFVAIGIIAAITLLGSNLQKIFSAIASSV